jgi:hypothetical protein
MRTAPIWILAVVALSACGNYSNEDVEFLSAIPSREQLSSKYAGTNSATALRTQALVSAIAVGEQSQLANDARNASTSFNTFLFQVLDLLDGVTKIAPSERQPNERIWGPFPDDKHPGWTAQMVMTRDGAKFSYHVDEQPPGSSSWVTIVRGDFTATGGLRKGVGDLHLLIQQAHDAGFSNPGDDMTIASVDFAYKTDQPPTTVDLTVSKIGVAQPVFDYSYLENADTSGQARFTFTDPVNQNTLDILARWTSTTSGRADATVIYGSQVGGTWVECWDSSLNVLYSNQSWAPPAVGDAAQCVFGAP